MKMIHFATWADTIEVVTESGVWGCYSGNENTCSVFVRNNGERRATVTTAGERMVERECGCMQTSIHTPRKAQMHTQRRITAAIHHALENETKTQRAEAFDSYVTANQIWSGFVWAQKCGRFMEIEISLWLWQVCTLVWWVFMQWSHVTPLHESKATRVRASQESKFGMCHWGIQPTWKHRHTWARTQTYIYKNKMHYMWHMPISNMQSCNSWIHEHTYCVPGNFPFISHWLLNEPLRKKTTVKDFLLLCKSVV